MSALATGRAASRGGHHAWHEQIYGDRPAGRGLRAPAPGTGGGLTQKSRLYHPLTTKPSFSPSELWEMGIKIVPICEMGKSIAPTLQGCTR